MPDPRCGKALPRWGSGTYFFCHFVICHFSNAMTKWHEVKRPTWDVKSMLVAFFVHIIVTFAGPLLPQGFERGFWPDESYAKKVGTLLALYISMKNK